jgi:hypothetical protein
LRIVADKGRHVHRSSHIRDAVDEMIEHTQPGLGEFFADRMRQATFASSKIIGQRRQANLWPYNLREVPR